MPVLAKDSFTAPPNPGVDIVNSQLDVGGTWLKVVAAPFPIYANSSGTAVFMDTGPSPHPSLYTTPVAANNYIVSVTCNTNMITNSAQNFGLSARVPGATLLNATGYYFLVLFKANSGAAPQAKLWSSVNTTTTNLASATGLAAGTKSLELNVNGTQFIGKWGGVQLFNINNSAISNGSPGLYGDFGQPTSPLSANTSDMWDNFLVLGQGTPAQTTRVKRRLTVYETIISKHRHFLMLRWLLATPTKAPTTLLSKLEAMGIVRNW